MIEAWNKADRLELEEAEELAISADVANLKAGRPKKLPISAVRGDGLDALMAAVEQALAKEDERLELRLPPQEAKALAWLHRNGEVLDSAVDPETGATTLQVRLKPVDAGRFRAQFPALAIPLGIGEVEDEEF
jgi:GTP-binding protein HflX